MAKFKCNHTGQVYEFKYDHDIAQMREHDEYEEMTDEEVKEEKPVITVKKGK